MSRVQCRGFNVEGKKSSVSGKMSRVNSKMSRVEGKKSRVKCRAFLKNVEGDNFVNVFRFLFLIFICLPCINKRTSCAFARMFTTLIL